jgi:glycosyltransferase involved in cell wall biosynthesis
MLHPSTQDNLLDESYKFKPYLAMQNFLSRKTAQRHDHVLANSETTKSFAESQWGIENVKTLPLPMQDRDVNRYECDHDFILSCGRMTRGKGFEYIPKAMRAILTKNPDMHLYIIGGDRDVAAPFNLPSGMRDRIHTVYQLPRLKLLEYMKAAECVVLGSLWEPFGYVCLEAMMTGSIVVASSGSGFEEQIRKSGENGFLFPPENLSKLQKAVSTVLSLSSDEKRRIEDNARRRAEDFLGEDTIDEQIRYYQEVIEKSS